MTVSEFVKKLKMIGYDENTELVFSYTDSTEFSAWHEIAVSAINEAACLADDSNKPCEKLIEIEMKIG